MAFATVSGSATGSETNGTAPTFTFPATCPAGSLVLFIAATDNTAAFTEPAGTTGIVNANISATHRTCIFGKVAAGTEGGTTIDGTLAASEAMTYVALVIEDWHGSLDGVEVSTGASGSSYNPDPDSLTPTWGAEDTLWLAYYTADYADHTATAWPTDYADNQITVAHSETLGGRQAIAVASRELAATSADPSTFTYGGTASNLDWAAGTIAIRPDRKSVV